MPTSSSSLLLLPLNYCVSCGNYCAPHIFICHLCYLLDECLPTEYRHGRPYHCPVCSRTLDRYLDFTIDGSFRSDHFFCIGCDYVTSNKDFDRRGYTDASQSYLRLALQNPELPIHIRQAYERQLTTFNQGGGIYIEPEVLQS